jgi:hypothetical protein
MSYQAKESAEITGHVWTMDELLAFKHDKILYNQTVPLPNCRYFRILITIEKLVNLYFAG